MACKVFDRIAAYTAFPWPVLLAQCDRCKLDPGNLDEAGLRQLVDAIVSSVTRFAGPFKAKALRAELASLTRKGGGADPS